MPYLARGLEVCRGPIAANKVVVIGSTGLGSTNLAKKTWALKGPSEARLVANSNRAFCNDATNRPESSYAIGRIVRNVRVNVSQSSLRSPTVLVLRTPAHSNDRPVASSRDAASKATAPPRTTEKSYMTHGLSLVYLPHHGCSPRESTFCSPDIIAARGYPMVATRATLPLVAAKAARLETKFRDPKAAGRYGRILLLSGHENHRCMRTPLP